MKLLDLAFPLVKGCGKHRILFPQLTLTNCAGFGQHEFQCRNRMVRLSGRHTAEVPVFAVLNTVNNDYFSTPFNGSWQPAYDHYRTPPISTLHAPFRVNLRRDTSRILLGELCWRSGIPSAPRRALFEPCHRCPLLLDLLAF